jgi:hypothetical protein
MSQSDKLKFQGGAAANTEREDRNEGGKNRHHARDGTAVAQKSLVLRDQNGCQDRTAA